MPTNHLLAEIAAILPTPDGTPTNIPLVIAPQGQEEDPPQVPRKSRKKIRTNSDSDPDFEFELTESDLINLDPVAQHRRNPSRNRRSPDFLHKHDTIYDHPKNKNQRKAIQQPATIVNDPDQDVYVDMTEQNQAESSIRVLMTMQAPAEDTEPVAEQPTGDGGTIAEPAPDASIMPPNPTTPGAQDPLTPTLDLAAGDGAGAGAEAGAGAGAEAGAGTGARAPPVAVIPPGPVVTPAPKEGQANGGAITKHLPTRSVSTTNQTNFVTSPGYLFGRNDREEAAIVDDKLLHGSQSPLLATMGPVILKLRTAEKALYASARSVKSRYHTTL